MLTPTNESSSLASGTAPITVTVTHVQGGLAGRQQVVHRLPAVIGRSHRCEIRLDARDTKASGRHAQLSFDGQALWLEDLGSTNGTHLNGRPIARAVLSSGDDIELGMGGPRLRVTFNDTIDGAWIGNIQSETYYLGVCEFPLRSRWRFLAYIGGGVCLLLPLYLMSLVAAILMIPLGLLVILVGWSLTRVNVTITPLSLEYQGLWRQVTLPWSAVTCLQVDRHATDKRGTKYTIVGKDRTLTFRSTDYIGGIELAQLIARRTGKRWETQSDKT